MTIVSDSEKWSRIIDLYLECNLTLPIDVF